MKCKYDICWKGQCENEALEGSEYCEQHKDVMCKCGEKATGDCHGYWGSFVCGCPVCDECREYHKKGIHGGKPKK